MNMNIKNFFIKIIVINASIVFLYYLMSPYQICKRELADAEVGFFNDDIDVSVYCQNSKYFFMEENQDAAVESILYFFDDKKKEDK